MDSRIKILAFCAAPLLLAGCGDGWEMQLTNTHFPYGNQRTAGSGVMYVRDNMMPQKDLNLKPVSSPRSPEAVEETKVEAEHSDPDKVEAADKIFDKHQAK